ncbi:esterase/lipase family protein [Arthrobacter methylotrophus]|uniref:Esterase/lipase family protein n=1 Tax=Arthrobacter methylotrophus TaxID=121291 RepID=A0ABV5UPE9_9MICC
MTSLPASADTQLNCQPQPNKIPASLSEVPVVYVHGWLGSADGSADAAEDLSRALGSGYKVFAFDYSKLNTTWGADSTIAGCLAVYIQEAATASRAGKGVGKAVAVAHSMGGIAVRAASGILASTHSEGDLAGLVTLGTPHQGSPFSGNYATASEWEQRNIQFKSLPLPKPDTAASKCLAWPRPSDCATVPYLTAGQKIATIGGQMTVQIKLFDLQPFPSADAVVGDGIVRLDSAWGYLGSAAGTVPNGSLIGMDMVTCQISTSYINYTVMNQFGPFAIGLHMWTDYGALDQLVAGKAGIRGAEWAAAIGIAGPPCAHGNLPTNRQADALAAKYVKIMANARQTEIVKLDPWSSPDGPTGATQFTFSGTPDVFSGYCSQTDSSDRHDVYSCSTEKGPGGSHAICFAKPGSTSDYACTGGTPTKWMVLHGMIRSDQAPTSGANSAFLPVFLDLANGTNCTRFQGFAAPGPPPGRDVGYFCEGQGGGVAGFVWSKPLNTVGSVDARLWDGKAASGQYQVSYGQTGQVPSEVEVVRAYG